MAVLSGQANVYTRLAADAGTVRRHGARAQITNAPTSITGANVDVGRENKVFELAAGATVVIKSAFQASSSVGTPVTQVINVWVAVLDDNTGTVVQADTISINALNFTAGQLIQGTDVNFTAPNQGTYRLRVKMEYVNDGVNGSYTADSDAGYTLSGTPNLWAAAVAASDQGYIRAGGEFTGKVFSKTLGGASTSLFEAKDRVFDRLTFSHRAQSALSSRTFRSTLTQPGRTSDVADSTALAGSGSAPYTVDASHSTPTIDNTWDKGALSLYHEVQIVSNSPLSGIAWTHFETAPAGYTLSTTSGPAGIAAKFVKATWVTNPTTPDSVSGNPSAAITGTSEGNLIDSPNGATWGKAILLDGVDLDDNSSAIRFSPTLSGVSGPFTFETRFRLDSVNILQVIGGKWGEPPITAPTTQNYAYYLGTDNKPVCVVTADDGTQPAVVGTSVAALGDNWLTMEYDGTWLRLYLNGVFQGKTACAALRAPNTTTYLYTGRYEAIAGAGAPFPTHGAFDEMRLSSVARYASDSGYTVPTAPFTVDADTKILAHMDSIDRISLVNYDNQVDFAQTLLAVSPNSAYQTPPYSVNAVKRSTGELGYIASKAALAVTGGRNSLGVQIKLWDNNNETGTESVPTHSFSGTTRTEGGESGWLATATDTFPIIWTDTLPVSNWTIKSLLTDSDLLGLEINNTRVVALVGRRENLQGFIFAGSLATPQDHIFVGQDLTIIYGIDDTAIRQTGTVDSGEDKFVIKRIVPISATEGKEQFYDGGTLDWVDAFGVTAYAFTGEALSGTDSKIRKKTFLASAHPNLIQLGYDFALVSLCKNNSSTYGAHTQLVVVGAHNKHSGYIFDGGGFIGFPSK